MISAVAVHDSLRLPQPRGNSARAEAPAPAPRAVHNLPRAAILDCRAQEPAVYMVRDGSVKLITRSEGSQRETILSILGPGQFFGQFPGVAGHPNETAMALESSKICEYPAGEFEALMQSCPELGISISRMLSRRLEKIEARVSQLLFKDSRQRIAYVLIDLVEDWGKLHVAGTLLSLRITHQDIANLAGLTRETVSMALAEFELEELIQTFGRKIVVRNIDKLKLVRDGKHKIAVPDHR